MASNGASTGASPAAEKACKVCHGFGQAFEKSQTAHKAQVRVCRAMSAESREYSLSRHRPAHAHLQSIQGAASPPASGVPSAESLTSRAAELSGRERFGCPENIHTLGRGTWSFLHTMAAYYPEQPSAGQQTDMREFLRTFSQFYPCSACAGHLRFACSHCAACISQHYSFIHSPFAANSGTPRREHMRRDPPVVGSTSQLSVWLCGSVHAHAALRALTSGSAHNEVNARLGKPAFDCSRVLERWRDVGARRPLTPCSTARQGWRDRSCDGQ